MLRNGYICNIRKGILFRFVGVFQQTDRPLKTLGVMPPCTFPEETIYLEILWETLRSVLSLFASYIVNNSIIAHSCEVETASVTSWWLLPQPLCDVIDHAHICYQILRCSGLVAAFAAPVGLLYHSLQTQSQSCWNKWCLTGDKTQISQEAALNMCLLVYKRIPLLSFVWRCRHRLKFRSCTFYSCVAGNIPFSWIEMHRTLIAALIYPYVWIVNSMLKSLDHQIPLFLTTLLLFIESAQKPQSPQYFSSSCPQSWRNAMHISLVFESSCISAHTTW